jgi:hypothetical protein
LNDDGIVILYKDIDIGTEVCAFGKHDQMFEFIYTDNRDRVVASLLKLHATYRLSEDEFLCAKVAAADEFQCVAYALDFHLFRQVQHVLAHLLKVTGRDVDDAVKVGGGDRDSALVEINQVELVLIDDLFLAVFDPNGKVVWNLVVVADLDEPTQNIVPCHCSHDFVQVYDRDADHDSRFATVRLEKFSLQAKVNQNGVCVVHGHNFHTRGVEFNVCFCQNLF